ncbi:hypothetical protein ACJX0J_026753, partial [Zea mays]
MAEGQEDSFFGLLQIMGLTYLLYLYIMFFTPILNEKIKHYLITSWTTCSIYTLGHISGSDLIICHAIHKKEKKLSHIQTSLDTSPQWTLLHTVTKIKKHVENQVAYKNFTTLDHVSKGKTTCLLRVEIIVHLSLLTSSLFSEIWQLTARKSLKLEQLLLTHFDLFSVKFISDLFS